MPEIWCLILRKLPKAMNLEINKLECELNNTFERLFTHIMLNTRHN